MNASATLNVFKLLYNPRLCMPQLTVPTFNQLPIPLAPAIKAIVIDKDNCISYPHDDKIWPQYNTKWEQLKTQYPGKALLIVSNSAGSSDDIAHKEAKILEDRTGVTVLRHSTKKPGCKDEILAHFIDNKIIEHPNEVAVIGDRLFTDIMMSNMMNSYGVWIKDGVVPSNGPISKIEKMLYTFMNK
ncbi:phosphatidylglycerophosphatase NDAI_0C01720 [Naumovozyma dairenensis CBS 421]|uniref:Phosphatidylglycerophosphatase GEP4, mitochondrial n=1 Tax=Naumovozyma dairenensis (strain ATCC 10597 / BCRC 20456 / CBS 421 / NBRC 0211 / NRRL Y-12639) TaxID=1071378 RepID=G0W7S2_NAUDC|nr:hypothetical protein NDAI_0C01720 [Naumovozyma dairenensis CBS 421]CCD23833.1 hypothetical protein NDAI_0C01720 [Naumovozyma dairenensis CBS 421]